MGAHNQISWSIEVNNSFAEDKPIFRTYVGPHVVFYVVWSENCDDDGNVLDSNWLAAKFCYENEGEETALYRGKVLQAAFAAVYAAIDRE